MKRDLESKIQRVKAGCLDPREADAMDAERIPIAQHIDEDIQGRKPRDTSLGMWRTSGNVLAGSWKRPRSPKLSQLRPSLAITALKTLRDAGRSDQTVAHYATVWKSFS